EATVARSPARSRFSCDDACSRRGPASAARPLATGLAATRGERRAARRLSQRLPAALRAQRDDPVIGRRDLVKLAAVAALPTRAALPVLHRIGVLQLIGRDDRYARESREAIRRAGGRVEDLSRSELAKRYPQISLEGITAGQLEPASGAVMARRAVLTLVQEMV